MKKINFLFLLFATTLFIVTSCSTKNDEISSKSLDEIVQEMSKLKVTNNDNAIFADIQYNVKSGKILNYKIEEREFDLVWIQSTSEKTLKTRASTYKVTCSKKVYKDSKGNPTSETTCDGKFSCGTAINSCLEGGGCAEICKALVVRIPEIPRVRDEELLITVAE
jgi:hypothetical protein